MQDALTHVEHVLRQSGNGLAIEINHIEYYYNTAMVVSMHSDNRLYISVTIPLKTTPSESVFKMYQVKTFSVTLHYLSDSVTDIQNVPPYFVVSESDNLATSSMVQDWLTCSGLTIKYYSGLIAVYKLQGTL